jgi:hypothetical protein
VAWTYDITAPAVGDKITAAGFGAQVDGAVSELQANLDITTGGTAATGATSWATQRDTLFLQHWSRPGSDVYGNVRTGPTAVTTGAGITTVVTAPGGGTTRVIKGLFIHATAAASTATLTLGSTVLGVIDFASAGLAQLDCTIPITSADTNGLRVTMTGGTGQVTCTYGDRTDALVTRLGLANGSTSGTLVASGTARTITELWVGNPSTSTAGAATVSIAGTALISAFSVPAKGFVIVDMPISITNAEAITWAGDSSNSLTYMAVGH